jgi:eukaryotic-like serine/threonine-protein kinase
LRLVGSTLRSEESGKVYLLGQCLGQGAHGVVFVGHERNASVATSLVVKVFRPSAVRHLAATGLRAVAKELAALRLLGASEVASPHVVRLLDAGHLQLGKSHLKLPWLALEHVNGGPEGTTLRERVLRSIAERGEAFDTKRLLRLTQCVSEGLTTIHSVGIVHRDLNPNNIFVTGVGENETFKVGDFGLARVDAVETYGAVLLGTPGYCAPEQSFPDQIGVGPHTDIFSLACCMFFAATGEPYFESGTIPEMLVAVHAAQRRSVKACISASVSQTRNDVAYSHLDALLCRCSHPNPERRPTDAVAIAKELRTLLSVGRAK